jgi:predicted RNA-binding protein YlqC (UPF0109 family)
MSEMQDKDFLEMIVKAIVGHPEKVEVDRTVDEMGVLLTLKIDPEDMGYVIGRRGQTAQAMRTLLKIVGAKNNARVNLKIHEPEGSTRPPRRERPEHSEHGAHRNDRNEIINARRNPPKSSRLCANPT